MNIPDFLIKWLGSFLYNRQQRMKIGKETSAWSPVVAGVPQGTLLGPVTFLVQINDLSTSISSVKYVDDTTLWEICDITKEDTNLQCATEQVIQWCKDNRMSLNTEKTKTMVISFSKLTPKFQPITIDNTQIEDINTFKLLGVKINNKLSWEEHVNYICKKAAQRLYFLVLLKRAGIKEKDIVSVYCSIIRSVLEYADVIWHPGLTKSQCQAIEHIQKRVMGIIYNGVNYTKALEQSGLQKLDTRREDHCRTFYANMQDPKHKLYKYLPPKRPLLNLRKQRTYEVPKLRTNRPKKSPIYYGLFKFQ